MTLRLGTSWQEIVKCIEQQVNDKQIAASLKMCLFHKLKEELKLTNNDLEYVLQSYSDTL